MVNDSESSNTSGEEEMGEMSDNSKDDRDDSSSGDSMDDGADIPPNHIKFNPKKQLPKQYHIGSGATSDNFRLEGTMNESDLNQENSNSANENSAENNLENYEVDIDREGEEDEMLRYGGPY